MTKDTLEDSSARIAPLLRCVRPLVDPRLFATTVGWHEDALGDFDPSHFSVPRLVWD
jgi:hypothetical protein